MELTGRVVRSAYAVGTKSERIAVMLETPDGAYVLRRVGGNAFQDPTLDGLVGQTIRAEGQLHGSTFLMNAWDSVDV
ncbi:MAG: hypothetical protein U0794_15625 [Isosphaeraceae bacterium]